MITARTKPLTGWRGTAGLLAGVWALYGTLAAQEPAEMTTSEKPAVFRSNTSLVLVPVVVRDSRGQVVTTLRKEDFRLTDGGKAQPISRFSVERRAASAPAETGGSPVAPQQPETAPEEAPPAGVATHFVIYLFDDVHMGAGDLIVSREAAVRHLAADLEPSDRAAVFTTSNASRQDFTEDRPTLLKALGGISPRAILRAESCHETTYFIADRYWNLSDRDADQLLTLQIQACDPNEDNIKLAKDSMALRALAAGEEDTRKALNAVGNAIDRLATMPGERTIVLVSAGFLTREMSPEKTSLMERAVRARIAISSLDARGLATYAQRAESPTALGGLQAQSLRVRLDRSEALETGNVLGELADGAAGVWIHDTNDLTAGFRAAASPAECVYLLGFAPQNLKYDGRFHAINVAVDGKYTVRARRGYYAPGRMQQAEEQAREEVREAVFSREEISDIPVEVRTQFFKPTDSSAQITVVARVDAQQLPYRKAEARNSDVLTVVTAVFDRDGNWVSGNEKTLALRLKDETIASRLTAGMSLRSSFSVVPGLYQIRVVVRDSEGQLMAASNAAVDIP